MPTDGVDGAFNDTRCNQVGLAHGLGCSDAGIAPPVCAQTEENPHALRISIEREDDQAIRLISARIATPIERRRYADLIAGV